MFNIENLGKVDGDDKLLGWFPVPPGEVRATNVEGAQFLEVLNAENEPPRTQITTISVTEVGGWLPVSVVNAASGASIKDIVEGLTRHVETKFRNEQEKNKSS